MRDHTWAVDAAREMIDHDDANTRMVGMAMLTGPHTYKKQQAQ